MNGNICICIESVAMFTSKKTQRIGVNNHKEGDFFLVGITETDYDARGWIRLGELGIKCVCPG